MPRYAILEHDHPRLHFDLLLESGDALWTWRLPCLPQPGDVLDAERVFDHRLVYLEYEGPVSGQRGTVLRRDQGTFVWLICREGHLEARLDGVKLHGLLRLTCQEDGNCWRCEWLG